MKLTTLRTRVPPSPLRTAAVAGTERIRGRRLQQIRQAFFRDHPLCSRCEAQGRVRVAIELDHIVPLFKGGKDVGSNRQGLCHACHEEKTREDMRP